MGLGFNQPRVDTVRLNAEDVAGSFIQSYSQLAASVLWSLRIKYWSIQRSYVYALYRWSILTWEYWQDDDLEEKLHTVGNRLQRALALLVGYPVARDWVY